MVAPYQHNRYARNIVELGNVAVRLPNPSRDLTNTMEALRTLITYFIRLAEAIKLVSSMYDPDYFNDEERTRDEARAVRANQGLADLPLSRPSVVEFQAALTTAYKNRPELQHLFLHVAIDLDASRALYMLEETIDHTINYEQLVPQHFYWNQRHLIGQAIEESELAVPQSTYLGYAIKNQRVNCVTYMFKAHWRYPVVSGKIKSVLVSHSQDLEGKLQTPIAIAVEQLSDSLVEVADDRARQRMYNASMIFNEVVAAYLQSVPPDLLFDVVLNFKSMIVNLRKLHPAMQQLQLPMYFWNAVPDERISPPVYHPHPTRSDMLIEHNPVDGSNTEIPVTVVRASEEDSLPVSNRLAREATSTQFSRTGGRAKTQGRARCGTYAEIMERYPV